MREFIFRQAMLSVFALMVLASGAQAMQVANCSGQTSSFIVNDAGEQRKVTLPPNGSIQLYGDNVILQKEGQPEIRTHFYERYCIWHDELIIQSRGEGFRRHRGF